MTQEELNVTYKPTVRKNRFADIIPLASCANGALPNRKRKDHITHIWQE